MNNVKLYISRLCIPNVVFDFCALPQIMFLFLYVGFYLQFQLWTSLMIKGHSCCGSHSKGRSLLLSNLQFVSWLYLGPLPFWGLLYFWDWFYFFVFPFWWSSFFGTWVFLVLCPLFGGFLLSHLSFWNCFYTLTCLYFWGKQFKMGSNRTKQV